jgi:hypothetical protein
MVLVIGVVRMQQWLENILLLYVKNDTLHRTKGLHPVLSCSFSTVRASIKTLP